MLSYRRPRSTEFRNVVKYCLWCHHELELNNTRDVARKNFCSHGHRQLWRFKHGKWSMNRMWERCNTPQANAKKGICGEKNSRYLGDRKLVKRPMCTIEGNAWRKAVFERDEYVCRECGALGGRLEAHHIKGYWEFPLLRFDVDNGVTLCKECHKKTDSYGWKSINVRRGASYHTV